jgi:hypothetical protein
LDLTVGFQTEASRQCAHHTSADDVQLDQLTVAVAAAAAAIDDFRPVASPENEAMLGSVTRHEHGTDDVAVQRPDAGVHVDDAVEQANGEEASPAGD